MTSYQDYGRIDSMTFGGTIGIMCKSIGIIIGIITYIYKHDKTIGGTGS